ncbi:hypothetical protein [Methylobacterium sp. Leaf469]|uniref:hypothetical protein n=1 Tax=Methylobacterium sp. Leaf469 TaxID=1736387 RepID=UPI0012E3F7AE|nr:hypothetical protein [Methylobacterium sp. Leaf469]
MAAGLIVPALEGLGAAAAWGYRAYRGYRLYPRAKRLEEMSKTANTLLNEVKPDECTGKCEKVDDKKQRKTPDDVLSDATRDPEARTLKDSSEQYNKKCGMAEADADFDSMQPNNIISKPGGIRVGEIEGGTQVVVRPKSVPSLEINPTTGMPSVIRYK